MVWNKGTSWDTQKQLFQTLSKGHLVFGSQENLQIFYFLKLIKNSLPHPQCQLFSMLSELLSPSASPQEQQLRWTLRKTFQENETTPTGHRIWSSQKSSMNYFSTILCSFCGCRVGVVGIRGWPLPDWWRKEWWKEEGDRKLPKSIQVQAPTQRFGLKFTNPEQNSSQSLMCPRE